MSDTLQTALLFLINTVFNLYLFILMIRLILVFIRANYFDPFTQFIVRLTDFLIKPTRKLIPNYKNIEIATLVMLIVLSMLKYLLTFLMTYGTPNAMGLFVLSLGDNIRILIEVFFYAILIQAIISWVQPNSPMQFTLYKITAPIMRPLHQLIPPVGGFDITPIPALIILQFLLLVLTTPILKYGTMIAISGQV